MAIIKVVKAGKTKASLKSALNYIANEEKITTITGKKLITPLNCWGSLKNIYDTMIATKELYRKAIIETVKCINIFSNQLSQMK